MAEEILRRELRAYDESEVRYRSRLCQRSRRILVRRLDCASMRRSHRCWGAWRSRAARAARRLRRRREARRVARRSSLGLNDFHGHLEPPTPRHDRAPRPSRPARSRPAAPSTWRPTSARARAATNPQHAGRLGGRPDRRQPAAVGAVPRRADDRGDERDRARPQRGRQPRVRRGRGRAAAHAERRLPPRDGCQDGDGLPSRRELPLPRRQRRARATRASRCSRRTRSAGSAASRSASSA